MSSPNVSTTAGNTISQDYINKFKSQLAQKLEDPDTDPVSAVVEVAHSSGIYEYISNLDSEIRTLSKNIDNIGELISTDKPTSDYEQISSKTPFELAAPVMRSNAKASARQSIAIIIAEVGVVAIAIWLLVVLFRGPATPTQFGQVVMPDRQMRTYVMFAAALMVVASIAGIVYVV